MSLWWDRVNVKLVAAMADSKFDESIEMAKGTITHQLHESKHRGIGNSREVIKKKSLGEKTPYGCKLAE